MKEGNVEGNNRSRNNLEVASQKNLPEMGSQKTPLEVGSQERLLQTANQKNLLVVKNLGQDARTRGPSASE